MDEPPRRLLSALSTLGSYLDSAGGDNGDLLLAVAPHVALGHDDYEFIENLGRLVTSSPSAVSKVLGKLLETYQPFFDYQDHLRSLLVQLAELGEKENVIRYVEKLRGLQGMPELFRHLTNDA